MNKLKFKRRGTPIKFKQFSSEEDQVWKILSEKQLSNLEDKASKIRLLGWKKLEMETEKVPDFRKLNIKLKKFTGWEVVMTNIQYEESNPWIEALKDKKFRITNYIRDEKSLSYTPLPDIFHDAFGHLPFFTIPQYARIAHKFGQAMAQAKTKKEKDVISNHWWYGMEFSLIKENGKIMALGTGLMSSAGELDKTFSSNVEKLPYDGEMVGKTKKSPHSMHKRLFVLESLDQLEEIVDGWLK